MQQFIGKYLEPTLAKYIANQIHKKYDKNSDGLLSFDEFYEMSLRKDYKFHRLLFQYCKYVVPQKKISIGKADFFFVVKYSFIISGNLLLLKKIYVFQSAFLFNFPDETYDSSISYWPPQLAMISFSIVQATVYSICLHTK